MRKQTWPPRAVKITIDLIYTLKIKLSSELCEWYKNFN